MIVGRKGKHLHKRGETSEFFACHSDWTSRLVLSASLLQHKVTAVEPLAVGTVDDNREITKIGRAVGVCRKEVVGVFGLEGFKDRGVNGTMLPTQVTNLACLGMSCITWRVLAAAVGIEVWASGFATAVLGDSMGMDVVRWKRDISVIRCHTSSKGKHTQSLLFRKSPEVRMDLDSD